MCAHTAEWQVADRFLAASGITRYSEDWADRVYFLAGMAQALRGNPTDLNHWREGFLTDEAMLRNMRRYSRETILRIAQEAEVAEWLESDEVQAFALRANGWLH